MTQRTYRINQSFDFQKWRRKGKPHVHLNQIIHIAAKYYPDETAMTSIWDEERRTLAPIDRRSDLFAAAILKELLNTWNHELPADEQMLEAAKALAAMSVDLIQLVKNVTREALSWQPENLSQSVCAL